MIRKHLIRTVCALAVVVIAGTTVPALAQEANESVQEQDASNLTENETVKEKKKHKKHKPSMITETDENGNVIKKNVKKEKSTETSEDGTVIEKKSRKQKRTETSEDGSAISGKKAKKEKSSVTAEDGTVLEKKERKHKPGNKSNTDETEQTGNTDITT